MVWLAPLRETDHYVVFKINLWFMPLLSNSALLVPVCLSTLYWRKLGVSNRLIATFSLAGKFLLGIYYFIIIFLAYWCSLETINFIRIFPTPNLLLQEASSEHLLSTYSAAIPARKTIFTTETAWRYVQRNHSIITSTNQPQLQTVETMLRHQILITFLRNEKWNTYSESFRSPQHRGWVKGLICETRQRQSIQKGKSLNFLRWSGKDW